MTRPRFASPRAAALAAAVSLAACRSASAPRPAQPARLGDAAPERIAAQQAAQPGARTDEEERRWGIGAAQARDATARAKREKKKQGEGSRVEVLEGKPARPR
jgi:hypothetical protein